MEGLAESTNTRILKGWIVFLFVMFHEMIFLLRVNSYHKKCLIHLQHTYKIFLRKVLFQIHCFTMYNLLIYNL